MVPILNCDCNQLNLPSQLQQRLHEKSRYKSRKFGNKLWNQSLFGLKLSYIIEFCGKSSLTQALWQKCHHFRNGNYWFYLHHIGHRFYNLSSNCHHDVVKRRLINQGKGQKSVSLAMKLSFQSAYYGVSSWPARINPIAPIQWFCLFVTLFEFLHSGAGLTAFLCSEYKENKYRRDGGGDGWWTSWRRQFCNLRFMIHTLHRLCYLNQWTASVLMNEDDRTCFVF